MSPRAQGPCPPHRAPAPRPAASGGAAPSVLLLPVSSHGPRRHPLTGSMFRGSDCAPSFSLGPVSRPAGPGAAVGPWAAASSCCCCASSCTFLTSGPGPVSVVMTAGHRAGHRHRGERQDVSPGAGVLPGQLPAGMPWLLREAGTGLGCACLHLTQIHCQTPDPCPLTDPLLDPGSLSVPRGGFAKGWWQQHRTPGFYTLSWRTRASSGEGHR